MSVAHQLSGSSHSPRSYQGNQITGQLTCYIKRTTLCATDTDLRHDQNGGSGGDARLAEAPEIIKSMTKLMTPELMTNMMLSMMSAMSAMPKAMDGMSKDKPSQ